MDLGVSGLASGFDWKSLVDQLATVERLPQRRLRIEQQELRTRNSAYDSLVSELKALQSKVADLKSVSLFQSRTAAIDDSGAARATAGPGALEGAFSFSFQQLATAAKQLGQAGIGQPLSATNDVSGLVLANTGFATQITDGTFTVNGQRVAVSGTDTLQDVFDSISAATGGAVTGSYDALSDSILLSGAALIVLGSATDSSNFLQVARLNNNGTATISSTGPLGGVKLAAALSDANLTTAVSDGGAGTGLFRLNGVDVSFTESDSLTDVIKRINESGAGVQASYDVLNDRLSLTNRVTGDIGMALEDVTGNFLAATGLSSGSLLRGRDLLYTINGGNTLNSHSNTITEASSALEGLSVTALQEGGTAVITVATDAEAMKSAITAFVDQYNKVQSLIETQTAIETGSDGKVTSAVLARETEVGEVSRQLRNLAFSAISGLQTGIDHLQDLGFDTGSEDDRLTLKDAEALTEALTQNANGVLGLFTDPTSGLASKLDDYLKRLVGEEGGLIAKQDILARQASDIDVQVADLERIVQANRDRMVSSFLAMEQAQAQTNQQLQFLTQQLGLG